MSLTESALPDRIATWSSWQAIAMALRGDALSAFPAQAFEEDAVVHRFLGRRQFILNRPGAIRRILVENQGNYVRAPATVRVLRPIFGRGLFLSHGPEWQRQRKSVAPAFAPRAIRRLARDVAAGAGALVETMAAEAGRPIDFVPVLQRLALGIIGSVMFSLDIADYAGDMRRLIGGYGRRLGRPSLLDLLLPPHVPTPRDVARRRFRRRWKALIDRIITDRTASGHVPQGDLFDMMSAGLDGAPPEMLADQVATIIVAGHETTAAALYWALYLLATAPAEQERIAAETASLDLAPEGAEEALPRLVATRAAIDETLRLYPPAFTIVRQALEDDVADGIRVPGGSLVLIAPWVLHRHRRLWREPDAFDPSRFLPDAPPPPRFAYLPFGVGPRVCVGQQFALTVTVLVVASLLQAFRIELAEPRGVRPIGITSTQPEDPPPFILRARGN